MLREALKAHACECYKIIEELDSFGIRFLKNENGDYAVKKVHHIGTYVLPMPNGETHAEVQERARKVRSEYAQGELVKVVIPRMDAADLARIGGKHRQAIQVIDLDLDDRQAVGEPGAEGVGAVNDERGPSVLAMMALVAVVVALVILVFFALGYAFGRAFL